MCKLGVISQERFKIEVKLLLSASRKSYAASIGTTTNDLEWLWTSSASRAISAVPDLLVSLSRSADWPHAEQTFSVCSVLEPSWLTLPFKDLSMLWYCPPTTPSSATRAGHCLLCYHFLPVDVYSMIHYPMTNGPKYPIHNPVIDRVRVVVRLVLGLGLRFVM